MTHSERKCNSYITLFLSPGGLGEVILQTPFYRALKKKDPDSFIDVLVHTGNKPVLENNPCIHRIYTYSSGKSLITVLTRILLTRKYEQCFVFDKSWKTNYLAMLFIRSRIHCGFKRNMWESLSFQKTIAYTAGKHETGYYLDMIDSPADTDPGPEIFPMNSDYDKVNHLIPSPDKPLICLLPGGARNEAVGDEPFRRWPIENYTALTERLLTTGFAVLLAGGETDRPTAEYLISHIPEEKRNCIVDLTGKLTFMQSCIAIGKACCIVCHDSGLMHMASCYGKNLICLFGVTSPVSLLPAVPGVSYLWADEDIYDRKVRIFGTRALDVNKRSIYFTRLKVDDVFQEILRKTQAFRTTPDQS